MTLQVRSALNQGAGAEANLPDQIIYSFGLVNKKISKIHIIADLH